MDYNAVLAALENATLFDLYRLSVAIDGMLDDPQRLAALKRTLRVGQVVEYFEPTENRIVKARINQLKRTRASVTDVNTGKVWLVPYYMFNLAGADTRLSDSANTPGLSRQSLSVGDRVAFVDRDGVERSGEIERLNPKTVSLRCVDGRWRVAYSMLFRVLDGDTADANVIEHRPD